MFILFLIFLVVNIMDMVTSYYVLPGESNPIVLLTGSISALSIFKILFVIGVFVIYIRNMYSSHFNYFGFILIIILGIFLLGLGVYSNIQGMKNPELVDAAASIPEGERQQMYFTFVSILYIIPLVLSLVAFKLYEKSVDKIDIQKPKRVFPWQKRFN